LVANVVERTDVRVTQVGNRLGLSLESPHSFFALSELGRQQLQRDLAPQAAVLSQIDFSHPSDAQHRQDLVRAKQLS
jgi:hypothetical protein